MDARDDGEVSKLSPGGSPRGQAAAPISSLTEAWLHSLDRCVIDTPLSETVLPLMRSCFFGGAVHAVLLLQRVRAISWLPILPASSWKSRSRDLQAVHGRY
jgi:hypothetical protein